MGFLDKEGLKYFWQKIKTKIEDASKTGGVEAGAVIGYTGEGILEGYDEVKTGYSTEEILTGETWTDGKPVYIRTFKGTLPEPDINGTTWVNMITDASSLVSVSGTAGARPYNNDIVLRNGAYVLALDIAIAGNTIMYRNLGIAKDTAFEITIKYTKTTDTGNFKYIEKKSVAPIDPVEGAVVDTLNVADKVKNAPSINLVQQMTGIPQEGVIAFDGDVIPEGYEEVSNPNSYSQTTKTSAASGESFMSVTIPSSGIYKISAFYRGYYTYNSLDTINAVFTSAKGVNLYNSRIVNIPSDGSTIRFANTVFVVATLEAGDEISFSLATGTQKGMNIADSSFLVAEKIG